MLNWLSRTLFNFVHRRNLVYNTCWEDPRLDRVALELGPEDTILVITSAGCNTLDYVLQEPKAIHAVDMNPRQNALLALKIAAIRRLDYETFWEMFGQGRCKNARELYRTVLRANLPTDAQKFWDKHFPRFFAGRGWRKSFYFHGTSGLFARFMNTYIDRVARVRDGVNQLLNAPDVATQREVYLRLKDVFWTPFIRWMMNRDTTLSLLGVPRAQRQEVEKHFEGGVAGFVERSLEVVFAELPIQDNYFWRVYLTGEYTPACCPEYPKPENFARLKAGLVDRIEMHTDSILDFLRGNEVSISRYVLLDHMDWLSRVYYPVLEQEWQAILERAAPRTRILWRSGGLQTDFVDRVGVTVAGQDRELGEVLNYQKDLAAKLHPLDRVHTYGSFYIADVAHRA